MEHRLSDISSDKDLDLAEVMAQIRCEAHKRRLELNDQDGSFLRYLSSPDSDLLQSGFSSATNPLLPNLKMQPELEHREQYEIGDLLGFHDETFVGNAYRVILRREPDDAGLAQYVGNLRSGRYSKIDILRSLRFSTEGRKTNVAVKGLTRASFLRKIYRLPVVGYLAQLVIAIFRLPVLIANFRRLESHTAAQFERVANHVNEFAAYFSEVSQAHYRQLAAAEALITANQEQLQALTRLRVQIRSLLTGREKLLQELDALKAESAARIEKVANQAQAQTKIQELQTAELQMLKAKLDQHMQHLSEWLQNIRLDVAQQENRLGRLIKPDDRGGAPTSFHAVLALTEQDHLLDSLYRSLEDGLRGTPAEIKEEVKAYLPVLRAAGITGEVLDVGCGRGEWLEVLREAGIQARGIDNNQILVSVCKELNLDVVEAQALDYLRSLEDQTLSAVTALHFAEHLSLQDLVRFLDEAARTLKPHGLLILETPNPENLLVGSCNFYLDPTHKNPIPIPTLKLLVEARGFQCQEVMKLHPVSNVQIEVKDQLTSHLNHYLYGPMNYAVVARKPEQA